MESIEQNEWHLIRSGDKKVFEKVFKSYYQPLCNYTYSLIKDIEESEEIVQNVFYTIWNKKETLDITISLKSYLYKAVHNNSLNKIKHEKIKLEYANDYKNNMVNSLDSVSENIETKELNKLISQAIDALPEQCGRVFKLSRFENLKYSEIATQLDISIKTVENHMGKALKILREGLKDYLQMIIWFLITIF